MSTKHEMQILIDFLENNKEKVLSYVKETASYKGSRNYCFVMVGESDPTNVVLSYAQANDHMQRTNIQLGRFLNKEKLNSIIAREKMELEQIVEGY